MEMNLLLHVCLASSFITGCLAVDCSAVDCWVPDCRDQYTPSGQCCPICGLAVDCSAVDCWVPDCRDQYTPSGQCCPICRQGKPGMCPLRGKRDVAGTCQEDCSSDYECPYVEKCCSNGCGHVCMTPELSGCYVNGINYREGDTIPSKCPEVCECRDGAVQCSIIMCQVCVGYTPPGQCCPICESSTALEK